MIKLILLEQCRGWATNSKFKMGSVYSKIAGFLIIFNISVLGLFFLFDDFIPSEINKRKDNLILKVNLFAKIVKPVLQVEDISHFEKTIRIENLLDDNRLYKHEQMKIYRFDGNDRLADNFLYFDGEEKRRLKNLTIDRSKDANTLKNNSVQKEINLAGRFFDFFQPLFNARIITEPIVEKRSRFLQQSEVVKDKENNYLIRVVAPIREDALTLGVIEVWEVFSGKEAYQQRNNARLTMLLSVSFLTLLFGFFFALGIARPIRKLSKQLDKKLSPDDVGKQLKSFGNQRLKSRKDEVGLLYRNLSRLISQISTLFDEKERFASEVSHELKNPIASIIAQVENLTAKNEASEPALNKIKEQAERMNKLISEISEAAVVDNDLVTQTREKFDLSYAISEIVEHYVDSNEYPDVSINSDIQKNVVLLGLPERVGQVVVNLLDNAISFSRPKGSITVQLHKKWRRKPLLVVEDSGPGVSEAAAERIFDRFYTSRSGHAEVENSSGLGLFICRQIIEAHGGTISVGKSALGGARFEVSF